MFQLHHNVVAKFYFDTLRGRRGPEDLLHNLCQKHYLPRGKKIKNKKSLHAHASH